MMKVFHSVWDVAANMFIHDNQCTDMAVMIAKMDSKTFLSSANDVSNMSDMTKDCGSITSADINQVRLQQKAKNVVKKLSLENYTTKIKTRRVYWTKKTNVENCK